MSDSAENDARQIRSDLLSILGYTCETQAPNSPPTNEYVTDRWMKPRLDALVEYVLSTRVIPPGQVPCVCGEQMTEPYPNDTGEHSTTECPIPSERTCLCGSGEVPGRGGCSECR